MRPNRPIAILAFLATTLAVSEWTQLAGADQLSPRFDINPRRALIDDDPSVRLGGLKAGQPVTVRARMAFDFFGLNTVWKSESTFTADQDGTVDLAAPRAEAGKGKKEAPLRILWSMKPDRDAKAETPAAKGGLEPLLVTFTAVVDGKEVASGTLEWLWIGPEVIRRPVRERGLVGTYFRPVGNKRYPGVLVLGGSDGGLREGTAARLASRGYATLALAYFNYKGLPKDLTNIPLEYFETGLKWLGEQDNVEADRLAVLGGSRGGELALLLGATFPQIRAVVAYVPSHVIWAGFPDYTKPAWTYQGKAVPFMSGRLDPAELREALRADPAVYTPLFRLRLKNADDARQAAIPVEKIKGPVLLLSGADDKLWPSALMSDEVMKRLRAHKHPYPDQHLRYEHCGHSFAVPHLPTTVTRPKHPVTKQEIELGGTAEANAYAAWDSWPRVLRLLSAHLKPKAD
jgi:dienelactone hydrolase